MNKTFEATFPMKRSMSSLLATTIRISGALVMVTAALSFVGCSSADLEAFGRGLSSGSSGTSSGTAGPSTPANLLHGQWQSFQASNKNVKSIFFFLGSDSTFEFAASLFSGAPQSSQGRYSVVGNRINLFPVGDVSEVLTFTLSGGVLTITDKQGNWMKLRR